MSMKQTVIEELKLPTHGSSSGSNRSYVVLGESSEGQVLLDIECLGIFGNEDAQMLHLVCAIRVQPPADVKEASPAIVSAVKGLMNDEHLTLIGGKRSFAASKGSRRGYIEVLIGGEGPMSAQSFDAFEAGNGWDPVIKRIEGSVTIPINASLAIDFISLVARKVIPHLQDPLIRAKDIEEQAAAAKAEIDEVREQALAHVHQVKDAPLVELRTLSAVEAKTLLKDAVFITTPVPTFTVLTEDKANSSLTAHSLFESAEPEDSDDPDGFDNEA